MRIRFADGSQTVLTYCTNVHAIEDLASVLAALSRYCAPVRRRLGVRRLSLGLWLSRRSASALVVSPDARARLRDALETNGLELVTLNGFPYGDFHAERVKEEVYRPDWADVRRHRYTLDLAHLLCELLPADVAEGTISTLPLTYAPTARPSSAEDSATILAHLAVDLDRLAERSGRQIRVCLEPEPDCIVETSDQAIAFFHEQLRPAVRRRGVDPAIVDRHLGLCFDACHQAVAFEDPVAAWTKIAAAGIRVGKVQLSCALEVPAEASSRAEGRLRPFDEIRFLHQVRRRDRKGVIEGWTDLGPALAARERFAEPADWRVHFHAPLHWEPEGHGLRTTAQDLLGLIPRVAATRPLPHLEVETYTWNVLPEAIRPRDDETLVEGIAREIEFAERALAACGARRES